MIECNLVDADYLPAMSNQEVLASIADPAYQTELGAYNIEFNVPPRPLPDEPDSDLPAPAADDHAPPATTPAQHG